MQPLPQPERTARVRRPGALARRGAVAPLQGRRGPARHRTPGRRYSPRRRGQGGPPGAAGGDHRRDRGDAAGGGADVTFADIHIAFPRRGRGRLSASALAAPSDAELVPLFEQYLDGLSTMTSKTAPAWRVWPRPCASGSTWRWSGAGACRSCPRPRAPERSSTTTKTNHRRCLQPPSREKVINRFRKNGYGECSI